MTDDQEDKLCSLGMCLLLALIIYSFLWLLMAAINRDYCDTFNLQYVSTDLTFNGTCLVTGVEVPAELIKRD